jgi:hypothetical protein
MSLLLQNQRIFIVRPVVKIVPWAKAVLGRADLVFDMTRNPGAVCCCIAFFLLAFALSGCSTPRPLGPPDPGPQDESLREELREEDPEPHISSGGVLTKPQLAPESGRDLSSASEAGIATRGGEVGEPFLSRSASYDTPDVGTATHSHPPRETSGGVIMR